MISEPGLRDRKKQQTRQLIAETALRLFARSGFDSVTVSQIARAANVSEGTVFNYFQTKESLVYHRMEDYETALLQAVRQRQPGEPVLTAFRRFVIERSPALAAAHASNIVTTTARMIAASAALRAREREIIDSYTQSLAEAIAEETGKPPDDSEAWVAANALMGVHRAMLSHARRRALDGPSGDDLAAEIRSQAERALSRLGRGLGDYAILSPAGAARETQQKDPATA